MACRAHARRRHARNRITPAPASSAPAGSGTTVRDRGAPAAAWSAKPEAPSRVATAAWSELAWGIVCVADRHSTGGMSGLSETSDPPVAVRVPSAPTSPAVSNTVVLIVLRRMETTTFPDCPAAMGPRPARPAGAATVTAVRQLHSSLQNVAADRKRARRRPHALFRAGRAHNALRAGCANVPGTCGGLRPQLCRK